MTLKKQKKPANNQGNYRIIKAAVFLGPHQVELQEVPMPDGEVVVRVKACGICAAERGLYQSGSPFCPIVAGHEAVGIVERVSERAQLSVGDHVALDLFQRCGQCTLCRKGRENICGHVGDLLGGFAEYVAVQGRQVFRIPPQLSWHEATFVEPLACCIHSFRRCNIAPGDRVAVVGLGPMGFLHLLLAQRWGSVQAYDIDQERCAFAQEVGATILDPTSARVDVVFVAAAGAEAFQTGLKILDKGGTLVIFAGSPAGDTITLDPARIYGQEMTILGSRGKTIQDFREAVATLAQGLIDVKPLISEVVPLDRIVQVWEQIPAGRKMRTIVEI